MRKLFVLSGAALIVLVAMASPAAAEHKFRCNEVVTGVTVKDVYVPRDGACTLVDSTVEGSVYVSRNAFFQATGTDIGGKVRSDDALTVFIDTGTTVGRSVRTDDTLQVFIFNATLGGDIEVEDSDEVVQICGTTVTNGDVEVERSGTDILVGDPEAVDCAGNTVDRGDVELRRNFTDVEFVVRGNTVTQGDLEVFGNRGPVEKFVEDNTGGDELECGGNSDPFTAANNTGWDEKEGQCREVLTCEATVTGVTVDDVVVPANGSCTLIDSAVAGNVFVSSNAFFQASNTDIGGKVRGDHALTVFIDTDSTVGRSVKTHETTQVFVFNATVGGDIEVDGTDEVVQICGTTVTDGDIEVERSGTDLLIGDPQAVDCAGNTVSRGDVEIERNFTDVEFVVRGNAIQGDLEVSRNTGPVPKFVQDNTGGDQLECEGNSDPFTASGNTGWDEQEGQCAAVAVTQGDEQAPAH
jgi:hypothetical protein